MKWIKVMFNRAYYSVKVRIWKLRGCPLSTDGKKRLLQAIKELK
jgi:hypothetical protein